MGKPTGKKKTLTGSKLDNSNPKENKPSERTSKAPVDEDTAVFITMSQELKEEGNRLFQKRDHEGAMLKYEKALKLLPRNHIDVAYLRSNMAACYMQMGIGEYPRAIHECNLALEVAPKYSKALLKRSKCYEALNRLDLALRDVDFVLTMEPNNLTALEIAEKVKKGLQVDDKEIVLPKDDYVEVKPVHDSSSSRKIVKEKAKKKKKTSTKLTTEKEVVETKAEDKVVVEEEKVVTKTVKLVLGDDIRWAQLPVNCNIRLVRDVVRDRFHRLKGILIKYRDQEGDLVTITTTDELRLAEKSARSHGSLKLHIVEVSPDNEPHYDGVKNADEEREMTDMPLKIVTDNGDLEKGNSCIEDWIVQFARLFKNHVGVESDSCLDLHEIGMKLYSEAMEETVTSEDAQELFEIAASKFQEMTALALFNWGNIHMSGARKRVFFKEDCPDELVSEKLKIAYDWARKEYVKAGSKYEEALKIKPDFYEGLLALGQNQFEQAKLCWYYAMGREREVSVSLSSEEVLELYNKAEDSMERGMQMWEEMEEQRLNGLSKTDKYKSELEKLGLLEQFKDIFGDESAEKVEKMKAQIYLLWGTLLYERSVVEFKLGLMSWEECLEVAVEKFELAGASPTDIAVMVKNHCSNETALEGLGFKIDEIVQAWNEMYDFERWQTGVPSFRLEPLFRRRVPKLHSMLEHV